MTKKFLITGVCGFVARYFIEYLQENNIPAQILGLDIASQCTINAENFKYKQTDLTNKAVLKEILENFEPDYIIHLASISSVSQSWKEPVDSFVNNTNIFLNLAESVRELNLSARILSVGSSEEYGNYPEDKMPLQESYELYPNNPYAVARVSQELLSKLYASSLGVDIVMTRSFNHIGPRQREAFVISSFVKQLVDIANHKQENKMLVGNTNIVRDFLDVRDVVDAYYKIVTKGIRGRVYNVCSGTGNRLSDIINEVSILLNITPKIEVDAERFRPADNMVIIGDNSKLKQDLGWSPKYLLTQTLQDMINYWKEN